MLTKLQFGLRGNSLTMTSLLFYAVFVVIWLTSAVPASANMPTGNYRFDVYYNGKRIGEHEFRVSRDEQEVRVQSRAQFLFKLLFVPVYRYEHVAQERWVSGCLQTLAATTNDNGEHFEVRMQSDRDGTVLNRLAPSEATVAVNDPCPASYAYWDPELLRRSEFINAQTGEVMAGRLIDHGVEERDGVPARRLTLQADAAGVIQLWYRASDSRWIGLETVRDGGTLVYRSDA